MIIKDARFVTSVATADRFLDDKPQIAFVGRSNVGKSSCINYLVNQNRLAKASSTPGRTRLVNYFSINGGECYFVDLPGYGFARVGDDEKERWSLLIEQYLLQSTGLCNVMLILDVRHQPTELDGLMIKFLNHYRIGFTIIATKVDKIKRSQLPKQLQMLATATGLTPSQIFPISSWDKTGKEAVLARIEHLLSARAEVIAESD